MKTEQEQIEEIAIRIDPLCNEGDHCLKCYALQKYGCINFERAKELYKSGYRKASDVIDDYESKMKQFILENCCVTADDVDKIWKALQNIAEKMRQELEK